MREKYDQDRLQDRHCELLGANSPFANESLILTLESMPVTVLERAKDFVELKDQVDVRI